MGSCPDTDIGPTDVRGVCREVCLYLQTTMLFYLFILKVIMYGGIQQSFMLLSVIWVFFTH